MARDNNSPIFFYYEKRKATEYVHYKNRLKMKNT